MAERGARPSRSSIAVIVAGLAAVLVASQAVEAQPVSKVPRIGVLSWETCPNRESVLGLALKDLGYTWGQTLHVVCQSAEGSHGRLAEAAAALASENGGVPAFVDVGGLATYSADFDAMVRRAATARDLNLTIPPSMLGRADKVID